jgi:hypothetical protein
MFERVRTTIKAMKRQLLKDEELRKLLYNDSNNALELSTPEEKLVAKYITTYPIYEFENKEDYKQQGMINIFMSDSDPSDEDSSISAMIRVNIVYNTDKWELIDGDCRTLALADRVIASLDKKKLTVSNPVEYVSTQELIISKQLVGYALLFDIVDGNSELEKF